MGLQDLIIYCADVGSIRGGNFGWARSEVDEAGIEQHRGSVEIVELVEAVAEDVASRPVALGFECPLFVPVPDDSRRLGSARDGDGNRPWSASAGTSAMATGLVQAAWVLREVGKRQPGLAAYLDWSRFPLAGACLFLWEAFVTGTAKAATHVDDAAIAVAAFRGALPNVDEANAVHESSVVSLLGAALIWSGWSTDTTWLHEPCLVIKAASPAVIEQARHAG